MKPKTILFIETGVAVAAVSLVVAFNSLRAATEVPKPENDKPVAEQTADKSDKSDAAPTADEAAAPAEAPTLAPPPLNPSPGMNEIFELARSGVSEEVLTAYIEKSGKSYNPSVEEIIYLKDLGVAPAAIATLIRTGDDKANLADKVENGKFEGLAKDVPPAPTEGDQVTPEPEHYAAAPQPIENAPVTTVTAPSDSAVDLDYFKASLAAYGSWVYVDGYGACWRPTVAIANSSWRPYFDSGRWVYTNCGWYWLSDYSWGWAPFHYGRWLSNPRWGWVWVPGYTWGPAWVQWRTTSAYCGWAPLPPYYGSSFGAYYSDGNWGFSIGWSFYNWVPYRYCAGYYPRHYAVHHGRGHDFYRESTVIRPTIIGNNNTVIVTGPDARVIANAGHTEIRRVNIRDVSGRDPHGSRDYLENGGRTLATFRPTLKPDRVRPETELANRRAEYRRTSLVKPSAPELASAEESNANARSSRNIILRGSPSDRQNTSSVTEWQNGVARRSIYNSNSSNAPRREGQNTTINARPEYSRPATESTPILSNGRTLNYNRPVTVSPSVVGGAIQSRSSQTTRYWSPSGNSSPKSFSQQSVRTPDRSYSSPRIADAPTISPSRRPTENNSGNSLSRSANSFRSQNSRSFSPSIRSGMTIPATPSRSYSSPTIAPPSRPSYSAPPSRPSFSQPSSSPSSRGFSRPVQSSAPSRSANAPSRSSNNNGSSRGAGPSRRGN
ncbi:hypothetical protein GC207_08870 [bacterium]|nr:hypothetical protein [bacterium]